MANDYYNSEGYYDPTAGEVLRNATSFRIVHPTGYVQIETDSFFPCTVEKSKNCSEWCGSTAPKSSRMNFSS